MILIKYVGSKNKLSKVLAPIIQGLIDENEIDTYLEPFVGGANMIDKIQCRNKIGNDNHKYLIALLQEAQFGTQLPKTVTKNEYIKVKTNKDKYPDWYVGLVGFCASYNSKWFGGYANGVKTKIGTVRNYTDESIRNLQNQIPALDNIIFTCQDYIDYSDMTGAVIYCDPPYGGTTEYQGISKFDSAEFWDWCRFMSRNNIVLISEYNAPEDFNSIWEQEVKTTLDKNKHQKRIEKLFTYRD